MEARFKKLSPIIMQVNITAARNTDGDAPDIKLNNHDVTRIVIGLKILVSRNFAKGLKINSKKTYINANCIPEIAKM
jgi:hypothetical protein